MSRGFPTKNGALTGAAALRRLSKYLFDYHLLGHNLFIRSKPVDVYPTGQLGSTYRILARLVFALGEDGYFTALQVVNRKLDLIGTG